MKLINGDELERLLEKHLEPEAFYDKDYFRSFIKDCLVNPADLDKMNLAAVGALDKICAYIDAVVSAADLKVPAKPEDVTVILSKVLDIIEEEGEMVPGRGAPNKIAVRPLLDSLDGLDRYPVPQEDKPDHKAMWKELILTLRGRFFGDFTVQEVIANYMEQQMEPRFKKYPKGYPEDLMSRETDVREKPEGKDGKQDELRSQRKPPTDCPPEKEKR